MRFFSQSILPFLSRLRIADPLVQVWGLAGISCVLLIMGQLRSWNASGEGKNETRPSEVRLLLGGARVAWATDFAAMGSREVRRPVLVLVGEPFVQPAGLVKLRPVLDLRPAMAASAGQLGGALPRAFREQLAQRGVPGVPLTIRLRWSGDARGNAALVERQQVSRPQSPTRRAWARLVIGNGSRSADGGIAWLAAAGRAESHVVEVTLVGAEGRATRSQLETLAELMVQLEAFSGHRVSGDPAGGAIGF